MYFDKQTNFEEKTSFMCKHRLKVCPTLFLEHILDFRYQLK